MAYVHQP